MLDIRLIREQPDFVKAELGKCGIDPAEVDHILETDARRRSLQHELDDLRAQRTRESRELRKQVQCSTTELIHDWMTDSNRRPSDPQVCKLML